METLKIKQKCEDTIKYAYIALRQFPKSEKFTLAADIKRSIFKMLELIIRCNKSRDKKGLVYEIDVELDISRSFIRLAMELGFLPFKKYEVLSNHFTELGRMVGGWIKFINSKG